MQTLLVTDQPKRWEFAATYTDIVCASDYIAKEDFSTGQSIRVVNLCQSYKYQSLGYYVSLLAQARNHKILPSVTTIQDLKNQSIAKVISADIDKDIQFYLKDLKSKDFTLSIYFGNNIAKRYEYLAKKLHQLFPAPLFRVEFHFQQKWVIKKIHTISINDVQETHFEFLKEAAYNYFTKKRFRHAKRYQRLYDLAILLNPDEKTPPSNEQAIKKFTKVAEDVGFNVSYIEKDDFKSLSEFDALFIRETTSVNHHSYLFARKAVAEGIAVIDDPYAILKCANKVYLAELLQKHKVNTPVTQILSKKSVAKNKKTFQYPCVLKIPDSAFSYGVVKVRSHEEFEDKINDFWKQSDLVIMQQYMPSDFDWRIGVLNGEPLYACKYYMAKDHWQIYNWSSKDNKEGLFETLAIDKVPKNVIETALKAAKFIGNSLYGVDLKEIDGKVYVIEINDNPSIDAGVEDAVLGDELYYAVIKKLWGDVRRVHTNEL